MVHSSGGNRNRSPRLVALLAVIILVPSYFVGAQDSATLELDPPKVVRGENVTIRIRTTIPWGEEVLINRPEIDGPVVWWAYPYARPWTVENNDGRIARMIEVLAAVRVDGPGFHSIDPFRITAGDREVVTDISRIIGLESDERDFPYPVFTQWRELPERVWQGQSIPVILEARNLPSLALAEAASLNQVPEGLLEDAPGLGDINTRPYGSDILYDVPMASWIWTLSEAGGFSFPGSRVTVNGLIRASRGFDIEVEPLPESVLASGAVGRFKLDVSWTDEVYQVGEIVSVRIRVEGSGNISVLRVPVPEVEGAELVSTGSSSSYIPGPLGYEGWREERFDFRIDRPGSLNLSVPEWTWFDPNGQGRVYRDSEQNYTISAEDAGSETVESSALRLLGSDLFRYRKTTFHGKNSQWYVAAIPGFLIFVILFVFRRPGIRGLSVTLLAGLLLSAASIDVKDAELADAAVRNALDGEWGRAAELYERLSSNYGELPGLLHDRAIIEMENGRSDTSVAFIRRAIYLRPGNRRFSETLTVIEERLGLEDQIDVPLTWSPSLVFGIWLAAVNGLFLVLAGLLYRREARDVILLVSVVLILGFASATLIYTSARWDTVTAVVDADSQALRKIPGPLASDWIKLPAGSAVSVSAREGSDCLVLTGYGLEGWLPSSSLNFINEANDGF